MSQALVQATINAIALQTGTATYLSTVTAGNLLTVICEIQGATATCTSMVIADTVGNTWTPVWGSIQSPAGGSTNKFIQGWFCINKTTNAANVVTITTNAANIGSNETAIGEFSGFTIATLDQTLTAANVNSTAVLGLSFSTTLPNEIIFAFTNINATQISNPIINAPFVFDASSPVSTKAQVITHAIAATSGSYALAGTWDTGTGTMRVSAGFSISANASTFSISGSAGVAGATVAWSGTSSGSTTADGSGNYTISGLANGSYTITPSLTGYTFSPTSSNQTVSGGNITGVNFVATQQTVATPTFSPVAGSYTGTQSVVISTTTPSSSIFYTTDGSTPTTGSTPYSGPVTVSVSLTLKAIATSSGFINSAVGSAAYIINTAAYYSVPDCRKTPFGPNSGITNQGTILYTGQTSSNPAVPGTDSRVSKPVDSRASVPTNSRTPGTFGPGE